MRRLKEFRDRYRRQRLLHRVLLMSLALHAAVAIIIAPLVIFKYVFRRETRFSPAAPIERRIDPRELEAKVKVRETHKKSGRPIVQPRLTAARVSQLSLPDIDLDIAPISSKALPVMRSFSKFGVSGGLGSGSGRGGLDSGESSITFFGIRGTGERIAIVVDVSSSMLEDERGGIRGFEAIKTEIKRLIKGMSPGTFFNIIMFSHDVDLFQPEMVLASKDNKQGAVTWIEPFNSESDGSLSGVMYFNYKPSVVVESYRAMDGTTRIDLALTAALEQGADTVFLLTDGAPRIRKQLPPEQWKEWQARYHNKAEQEKVAREREKWDDHVATVNEKRAKKGLPPVVVENPPSLKHPTVSDAEVIDYIDTLQKMLYSEKKLKQCRIHVVAYETDKESEIFLRKLVADNHGRFRKLRSNFKPVLAKKDNDEG